MDRRMLIGAAGVAVAAVVAAAAGTAVLFDMSVRRSRKKFLRNDEALKSIWEGKGEKGATDDDWLLAQPCERWEIRSADGLKLVGYWLPAAEKTSRTVMIAHGYNSHAFEMGEHARMFRDQLGCNVFLADARAHGASEGRHIGYGWLERRDWPQWIGRVIARVGPNARIALFGVSMGAATMMMLSPEPLPANVKAIVEDCGYSSVKDELTFQMKRMFHLPPFPLLQTTSAAAKALAGYRFEEADALACVRRSRLPILFLHGSADRYIPVEMAGRLYDACTARKEIMIVEGAGHALSYRMDRETYVRRVDRFLWKHGV